MLKHFKIGLMILVTTASFTEAVAQSTNFKEVLLDGKPAILNIQTGEVQLIDPNSEQAKAILARQDSISKGISKKTIPKLQKEDVKVSEKKADIVQDPSSEMRATELVYEIARPEAPNPNNSNYHIVSKGETLYALSRRYNTTLGELKRANNLETTLIKTGQRLRVRNFEDLYSGPIWTVVKGDTLYSIAKRTNTTVQAIKDLNGLRSDLIKIGQQLRVK